MSCGCLIRVCAPFVPLADDSEVPVTRPLGGPERLCSGHTEQWLPTVCPTVCVTPHLSLTPAPWGKFAREPLASMYTRTHATHAHTQPQTNTQ